MATHSITMGTVGAIPIHIIWGGEGTGTYFRCGWAVRLYYETKAIEVLEMFNPFMQRPPVDEIMPEELKKLIDSGTNILLLDVRTQMEYSDPQVGHLKNAMLIPLQTLWHHHESLEPYKDQEIIVYCRSGQRSAEACRILNEKGYQTKNMVGGIIRWHQLQYDVER